MNPIIDVLKSHRSIRQFTDQPIDQALFAEIIMSGQAAASSNFLQGVTIIRVNDRAKRAQLRQLSGNQPYVESAAEFLVMCADLNRAAQCCDLHDKQATTGFTEQFILATVDTALAAQNICVVAESVGLGICYIGAVRNHPDQVSELLNLPDNVYPVFGLCLGWPDQAPEVKPRLPLALMLHENAYPSDIDRAQIEAYDAVMVDYYKTRTDNKKTAGWSEQMSGLLSREARPHMLEFLRARGFMQK